MEHTDKEVSINNTSLPPQLSYGKTLEILYPHHISNLAKKTSTLTKKMATYSCHISYLKCCRDHDYIPKGLQLSDPVKSTRSSEVIHHAAKLLISGDSPTTEHSLQLPNVKRTTPCTNSRRHCRWPIIRSS